MFARWITIAICFRTSAPTINSDEEYRLSHVWESLFAIWQAVKIQFMAKATHDGRNLYMC